MVPSLHLVVHPDGHPRRSAAQHEAATAAATGQGPGELLVDFILSLDGCAAGEGWPGWWGLESREYLTWLGEQPDSVTLMGATTYRLMSQMAQQAQQIDVSAQEKDSFAQMAQMPKIVFSSTLQEPLTWPNTTLISTDAIEAVRELKRTATAPLSAAGTGESAQSPPGAREPNHAGESSHEHARERTRRPPARGRLGELADRAGRAPGAGEDPHPRRRCDRRGETPTADGGGRRERPRDLWV